MNPQPELKSLTSLFPNGDTLIERAEHVAKSLTPQPYKKLLVHDKHMTVTMEAYHESSVDVRIIDRKLDGDFYCRQIVLVKSDTDQVVQFGIVRFNFQYVTAAVREEIVGGQIPLGRVLINHNVLRHVDLGAIVRLTAGDALSEHLKMPIGGVTYGRLATIFCNHEPAVDLLEVSAMLNETSE